MRYVIALLHDLALRGTYFTLRNYFKLLKLSRSSTRLSDADIFIASLATKKKSFFHPIIINYIVILRMLLTD